ncbi:SMP-30/gluconolactonase/LRE family protein [Nitratireductor sp. ZSWI3]|uniref:SMP-30/gluconolactonase/LRE family protein n=1 Tax=Nitratireductor sp. ZSWI3 TaxID=2966359 RepID=UPI00214FCE10|nr:SMP-30/gluconolactonase/LRE family protein [Nitratireductor sp. ZSWI3]MCR4268496.1 SMP-30/gluconolactonase/LRE family protein [Nitratireductor sp. ZSWI3]
MKRPPDIDVVCPLRHRIGESPLWEAQTRCLWWVDVGDNLVRRLNVASGALRSFALQEAPAALALAADGGLIVAAGTVWYRLDSETGTLREVARLEGLQDGMRLNDGVVDGTGRFWTGTMSTARERPPVGRLYRLEANRPVEVLGGLRTQNGAAVSPDGRTFYLADSHSSVATIWAFDLDPPSGTLSNRRVFHRPERGRPDGAAVDAEGCYWFAAVDGGEIVRLDPDGDVVRTIELPVSRPTKPAFGGSDLSTLYVTTMSAGLDEETLAAEPLAGLVLALDPGVRGFPQPRMMEASAPADA